MGLKESLEAFNKAIGRLPQQKDPTGVEAVDLSTLLGEAEATDLSNLESLLLQAGVNIPESESSTFLPGVQQRVLGQKELAEKTLQSLFDPLQEQVEPSEVLTAQQPGATGALAKGVLSNILPEVGDPTLVKAEPGVDLPFVGESFGDIQPTEEFVAQQVREQTTPKEPTPLAVADIDSAEKFQRMEDLFKTIRFDATKSATVKKKLDKQQRNANIRSLLGQDLELFRERSRIKKALKNSGKEFNFENFSIIKEARDAINKGAPSDAVIQRLKGMGFNLTEL